MAYSMKSRASLMSLKPGDLLLVNHRQADGQNDCVRFGRLVQIVDAKVCIVYLDRREVRTFLRLLRNAEVFAPGR